MKSVKLFLAVVLVPMFVHSLLIQPLQALQGEGLIGKSPKGCRDCRE
jgi:hypothetical protein